MDINELLKGAAGQEIVGHISKQFGLQENEAASVVQKAMPAILGGLGKNAQNPQGAEALHQALNNHAPSKLDNLGAFFGNTQAAQQDGQGILGHVFGNQKGNIAESIAKSSGVSLDKAGAIISMLAPLVMSFLSKQKQENNVTSSGGLGDLIGNLGGGQAGNLIDMVTGMMGGAQSTKGRSGLGGLLGGLLGKK